MKDTKKKSILKTITWTTIVIIMTSIVIYVLTGKILESIGAGALIEILEMFAYYGHERLYARME